MFDDQHWKVLEKRQLDQKRRLNVFLERAAEKVEAQAERADGREKSRLLWKAVEIRSLMVPRMILGR